MNESQNKKPNNPPAMDCKWCELPAHVKQGRIWLCKKHYRFQQMRVTAKRHCKTVPSYTELDTMLAKQGLTCHNCTRALNWLQKEGSTTVVTLQHDDSGAHRFLCPKCNTTHASSSRDLIYQIKDGERFCKKCESIKPVDSFFKDANTTSGLKSYCKDCSNQTVNNWRANNTDNYNAYQRKHMLAERERRLNHN